MVGIVVVLAHQILVSLMELGGVGRKREKVKEAYETVLDFSLNGYIFNVKWKEVCKED